MSRTLRRSKKDNKIYPEGQFPKVFRYVCRCSYCTGVDKQTLVNKIQKKELKQLINYNATWI